jgi:hypothetical protein
MCNLNRDPVEFRKDVWRAVRGVRIVTIAPIDPRQVRTNRPGLLVLDSEKHLYCDGRVSAEEFCCLYPGRESVVFIPLTEEISVP